MSHTRNLEEVMAERVPELGERVARLNDIESVMERLKLGRSTVFAEIASGRLRSVKVGRRRLVPESAIVEFIDNLVTDDPRACLDQNTLQRTDDPRGVVTA
jgi:excisionase family DNA binding protein